ncbi:hypothetical protein FB45DRAFT_930771 [Roridomyces roridus]|uniref:Uncharacterized protein n=1 Tax=Roridomyces roridus TaxID=1738132 RepID=A0AAD7BFG3_9AGAR|nr:hypothetical protein FB45DRAFT_930771 [Roridomyces roridus]
MTSSSSFTEWTKTQFTALYASGVNEENNPTDKLDSILDATFSSDVEIHLNHVAVDLDKFKEFVERRLSKTAQLECSPEDLIETPVEDDNPDAGSIVAGKVTLVRTFPFRIRAAPAKTSTVIMFSAKIKHDRIVQLFQTTADKSFRINLSGARNTEEA